MKSSWRACVCVKFQISHFLRSAKLPTPWRGVPVEKLTVSSASREIIRLLWNQKVRCRGHRRRPPVPNVSPEYIRQFYLPRFILIRTCIPLDLPNSSPLQTRHLKFCIFLISLKRTKCSRHSPRFYHHNKIWWSSLLRNFL